jgi:hypothetical protein
MRKHSTFNVQHPRLKESQARRTVYLDSFLYNTRPPTASRRYSRQTVCATSVSWNVVLNDPDEWSEVNLKMVKRAPHPGSKLDLPSLPIGSADSADAERERRSLRLGEITL